MHHATDHVQVRGSICTGSGRVDEGRRRKGGSERTGELGIDNSPIFRGDVNDVGPPKIKVCPFPLMKLRKAREDATKGGAELPDVSRLTIRRIDAEGPKSQLEDSFRLHSALNGPLKEPNTPGILTVSHSDSSVEVAQPATLVWGESLVPLQYDALRQECDITAIR